jgi:hypothetical protein
MWTKENSKIYARDWARKDRLKNPEKYKTAYKNNRERSQARGRAFSRTPKGQFGFMRRRAKKESLELNLTFEEFLDIRSLPCQYCKGTLPEAGSGIDRQDNRLGYISGNCVPCCGSCNTTKGLLEAAGLTYPRTLDILMEILAEQKLKLK